MKNRKIVIILTTLALIIIPVSIKAVSTIIEKVKVVPDVPEPILQNVPEEAYIRTSNDILEEKTVSDPELEEKLKNSKMYRTLGVTVGLAISIILIWEESKKYGHKSFI